jgi:hypothetical protein
MGREERRDIEEEISLCSSSKIIGEMEDKKLDRRVSDPYPSFRDGKETGRRGIR